MNKLVEELPAEEQELVVDAVFTGISVRCQGCGGTYHELTEKFVPGKAVRGSYLRLLERYGPRGQGWYDFPHQDWVVGDNVACPQCGTPYKARRLLRVAVDYYKRLMTPPAAAGMPECEDELLTQGLLLECSGDLMSPASATALPEEDLSIHGRVLKLTWEGRTQAEIAETCDLSIYMVRRIQKGEK